MNATEMRALKADELQAKPAELKRKIFDLKMKLKSGRLDSTAELETTKRELARVNTLLREAELGLKRDRKDKKASKK